jgi:hypothetical protein
MRNKAHRFQPFSDGIAFDEKYWMALLRQVLVGGIYLKILKLMVS